MVQGVPTRCLRAEAPRFGAIAQLGERYNGIVEVKGSSPFSSTRRYGRRAFTRTSCSIGAERFDRFRSSLIN